MTGVLKMINSVKKAMDILAYLSNSPEESVPLKKLSQDLGLNKSTCSHILDTLCTSLFVERVSRKDGYRLGAGAYMLTRYGRYQESLIEICSPVIKWLNDQLDATVFLTVVCDGMKYIIFHIDSEEHIDIHHSEIIQGNIETTASGLLMMAYMDTESLERVASRSNRKECWGAISAAMENQLRKIRGNGYAQVSDEAEKRQSFAFRIWDGNRTVASIGVLYPNSKNTQEMRRKVIVQGKTAAAEVSRRLMFKNEKYSEVCQEEQDV